MENEREQYLWRFYKLKSRMAGMYNYQQYQIYFLYKEALGIRKH